MAPSILERPSLSFLIDSGISFPPCFFTCGANSRPTQPAIVHTPSTVATQHYSIRGPLSNNHTRSVKKTKTCWLWTIWSPRNWLTLTAPPVACLATWRPLVTVGLTWAGLSSGVMCSRSLDAPLWIALPVNSAPFTRPQLSQDAPERTTYRDSYVTCFPN